MSRENQEYCNMLDLYKHINMFRLSCVTLRIGLENLPMRTAMTSNRLAFALVEIDNNYSLTLPRLKSWFHKWSRDQPQPGSFSERQMKAEEREPGNEIGSIVLDFRN